MDLPGNLDYKYSPLQIDCIRLLRLEKRQSKETPVQGSLITRIVSNAEPLYTTLSYSWGRNLDGDASLNRELLLDGRRLPITENLHDFLLKVSHPDCDPPRLLWIDAVCINQADIIERRDQVSIMRKIYQNANDLIIWLGHSSIEGEDEAALNQVFRECNLNDYGGKHAELPVLDDFKLRDFFQQYKDDASLLRAFGLDFFIKFQASLAARFRAGTSLCRRRWFKRRWVVQEIHKSRDKHNMLHWGSFNRSVAEFRSRMETINTLIYLCPVPRISGITASDMSEYNMAIGLLDTRMDLSATKHHVGYGRILDCLQEFDYTDCADDRDRIYAFLSLGQLSTSMVADYQLSVNAVSITFITRVIYDSHKDNVARVLFLSAYQLRFQYHDDKTDQRDPLPTWVPNFKNHIPRYDLIPVDIEVYHNFHNFHHWNLERSVTTDGRTLILRARLGKLTRRPERSQGSILPRWHACKEEIYFCRPATIAYYHWSGQPCYREELTTSFVIRPVATRPGHFVLMDYWTKQEDPLDTLWNYCIGISTKTVYLD